MWFNKKNKKEKKYARIKYLIQLMKADGISDAKESLFLATISEQLGLNQQELMDIIEKPQDFKSAPPETVDEKLDVVIDLTIMIYKDGKITPTEEIVLRTICRSLGFSDKNLNKLLAKVLSYYKAVQSGDPKQRFQLKEILKVKYADSLANL